MSPGKVLAFFCACLFLLGALAWSFPEGGVSVGPIQLNFPTLLEVFSSKVDSVSEEKQRVMPDEQLQRMAEAFSQDSLTELLDSLHYYRQFFDSSAVRIVFPCNDPSVWDSVFSYLDSLHDNHESARVIHYGDSQIEQDRITSSVRSFFTSHFGGCGVGAVPSVQAVQNPYYKQTTEGSWQRYAVYGPASLRAGHRRYGPLCSMATVRDSATVRLDPGYRKKQCHEFSSIRVLYGHNSSDFTVSLRVGESVSTQCAPDSMLSWSDFYWQLSAPADHLILTFRGSAEVYGILLDGDSGVCVDNVPMRGSSGSVFTSVDRNLLRQSYLQLNVRMVLMEFGGNSMPYIRDEKDVRNYVSGIERQIKCIRWAVADMPILFIGPADMACTVDGEISTYPMLETLVERLRQVCLDNGVAYWDMYRVMGGRNSIVEWAGADTPYAASDYVHFTNRGAQRIGSLLENALSVCYDYYRFRQTHPNDSIWKNN